MMATKVLLIEDDPDDRYLFEVFFKDRQDIDLLPPLTNGLELIDYLEATSDVNLPHLIVLDQNMPKMNGKQTLEFLKSAPRYRHIATVIYSTYIDTNLIVDCKKLGAGMVAVKPIDNDGYQKMMNNFLQVMTQPTSDKP